MSSFPPQDGKNYRIRRDGSKYYLWIGDKDIMLSPVNESDIKHADIYSVLTALCRIISKGLKRPLTWEVVVDQLAKSGLGRSRVWTATLEQHIREDKGLCP